MPSFLYVRGMDSETLADQGVKWFASRYEDYVHAKLMETVDSRAQKHSLFRDDRLLGHSTDFGCVVVAILDLFVL